MDDWMQEKGPQWFAQQCELLGNAGKGKGATNMSTLDNGTTWNVTLVNDFS